jgi:hypothetical protein
MTEQIRVRYVIDRNDEVTAIFIDQIGNNDPNTMMCYSHIGQHSYCTMQWYNCDCIGATPSEYQALHKELLQVYSDLYIVGRIDSTSYKNRLSQVR